MSLREAIQSINQGASVNGDVNAAGAYGSNDTIQFGLPSGPQTISLTGGALNITQSVTITGPGAVNLAINGNNLDRVFVAKSSRSA